jgi:uncharacterized protein with PQ loop repeat
MMYFLLNILPQIGTFLIGAMYIPQVLKTYKTKDVRSMSLLFWIMLVIALSTMTANAIVVFIVYHTYGLLITEAVNLVLALIVLIQVLLYRNK